MRHARLLWIPVCLIMTGSLVTATAAGASPRHRRPRKSRVQLRRDLHNVRVKMHEKRAQIHQVKVKEHHVVGEIDTIEGRILATEGRLRHGKQRLAYLASRKGVLVRRIDITQKRLDVRKGILNRRLRENYEAGNANYVQVLLRSRSMHDYMSRSYYVERIVDSDVKLMAGIRADQRQLAADKQELEAREAEQKVVQQNLESDYFQYRADVKAKRVALASIQEDREQKEAELDELEEASHDIESMLRAIQQTPRGRARMLRAWTGHFIRPADGPITSGFGSRFHPILHRTRMHTGVDIGAGYGEPIHAAAGGEVVMAGYMRGYGNVVIIDHGGGVSTLYGHCSQLLVSEGQTVRQGQTIARVGATGLATGPHLHFEVRHNGTPVNPL